MFAHWLLEPLRAYYARKRLERLQYETAAALFRESSGPQWVDEDPDADDWRVLTLRGKEPDDNERETIRDKARHLADHNPYARNVLTLYRNYTVGTGMRHEVVRSPLFVVRGHPEQRTTNDEQRTTDRAAHLWQEFLAANDWETGNRKDWEFCVRTWRDGECFLRLFRQVTWPPRIHFVDPEHVAADPQTGLPAGGIETAPGNVEMPLAYWVARSSSFVVSGHDRQRTTNDELRTSSDEVERVEADRILHTRIGVDANVKRGVSIFLPVLESLRRFQGWLDVEMVHRKMAASIVFVRKHQQNSPAGVSTYADNAATSLVPAGTAGLNSAARRRLKLEPGTIIDAQGFDLEALAPNTHFDDAAILGRMILLSIAAGTGLPEFMLTADASNANYASTLVAEGPAVRHFAAWQNFFIGQWQKLFGMVMQEAVRLGFLEPAEANAATLQITPPTLAVRNRHDDAKADALYYDRGALSARELARRDGVDPDLMQRERNQESGIRSQESASNR